MIGGWIRLGKENMSLHHNSGKNLNLAPVVRGERVTIPLFEIVSNPTVRIAEVRQRRFNVIDRHAFAMDWDSRECFWEDLEGKL